jgi:hypothetical protein
VTLDDLRQRRAAILELAHQYGASNVRVFGSVARGTAESASDVDLLVNFAPGYKLRDVIRLTQGLQQLLGRRVDVVDEANLRDELRPYILSDTTPL